MSASPEESAVTRTFEVQVSKPTELGRHQGWVSVAVANELHGASDSLVWYLANVAPTHPAERTRIVLVMSETRRTK